MIHKDDINSITKLMKNEEDTKTFTKKLTVLIGPPRAGKTTHCSKLTNSVHISRDLLVEEVGKDTTYSEKWKSLSDLEQGDIDKLLNKNYQDALKSGKNIIVDLTNMSKKSRKKWLSDSKTEDYLKVAKVFIEPKSVLMGRMTEEKNIPEYVIDNMMKSFVWPSLEEFDLVELQG
jgi:predicted kinase